MITIKQTQRSIHFSAQEFHTKADLILIHLGYKDFDLGIWLTTDRTIKRYNHLYRHKNKATDVLSFPYHPTLQAGKKIKIHSNDDKNLGDILISVPYVFANKHSLEGSFQDRMDRMLVHGICHLLGYDHHHDADFKKMFTLEKKLLKLIHTKQ